MIIAATFGLQALTLVSGVIIARVLGVEGRGMMALVFAVSLLSSQLTFGASVPIALAKNIAERQVTTRDGFRDIARRRFLLLAPPSLAAGLLILFLQASQTGNHKYLLATAASLIALQTMILRILTGGLQGEGRLVRVAVAALVPQLFFTVVLAVGWVTGWQWGVPSMLLAFFASALLGIAFAFACLVRPRGHPGDALDEGELWAESRRSYVSSVRPLDGLQLDRILVGGLVGTVSLGLYSAASAVSNLCSLVSAAVAVVVLPRVAMNRANPAVQRAVIRRWILLSSLLIALTVIALELVVRPVILTAFGDDFAGAIDCARWLILADGLMAMRRVLIAILQGQGKGGTASWIEFALLPILIAGIVIAALQDSLVAIGISLTCAGLVSCVCLGWAVAFGRTGSGRAHRADRANPAN